MHNKVREPLFHLVKRDTLPWYQAWGIRAVAIVLALLLLLAARLVYLRALATGTLPETLFTFLVNTASLSVGLGLFNLVPVPPLDGSKVVAVLLPDRAYNWLMRYEQFGMVLLVIIISVGIGSNALDAAIRWVFDLFCRIVGF